MSANVSGRTQQKWTFSVPSHKLLNPKSNKRSSTLLARPQIYIFFLNIKREAFMVYFNDEFKPWNINKELKNTLANGLNNVINKKDLKF